MNIEQARAKLASVSGGTATKHPKVLVSELCTVVKFLLDELDRIKTPTFSLLPKRLPEDVTIIRSHGVKKPWPNQPVPQFPTDNPSVLPTDRRIGNAGDAE